VEDTQRLARGIDLRVDRLEGRGGKRIRTSTENRF